MGNSPSSAAVDVPIGKRTLGSGTLKDVNRLLERLTAEGNLYGQTREFIAADRARVARWKQYDREARTKDLVPHEYATHARALINAAVDAVQKDHAHEYTAQFRRIDPQGEAITRIDNARMLVRLNYASKEAYTEIVDDAFEALAMLAAVVETDTPHIRVALLLNRKKLGADGELRYAVPKNKALENEISWYLRHSHDRATAAELKEQADSMEKSQKKALLRARVGLVLRGSWLNKSRDRKLRAIMESGTDEQKYAIGAAFRDYRDAFWLSPRAFAAMEHLHALLDENDTGLH